MRFGHTVTAAEWDEETARWKVETDQGSFTARVFVPAMGPLAEPKKPDIPGLDSFEGKVFHSARWDHDHDLTGERVASIGTGASAIQYVPTIQPDVSKLHVFQRTAPWVMPHSNRAITGVERRLYRAFPPLQRLTRGAVYSARELLVLGFAKRPKLMNAVEKIARRHMSSQISDPELLRKVTPDYTIGCKRILPSNDWYPALDQPNVELVTDAITEVKPHSVVTADGTEREVDTIILGTGFAVTDMPVAAAGARARRQADGGHLGGQPARSPGHGDARLPQPVHAARPEHRPGAQLDGLHDRVPGAVRDRRDAQHARQRRGHGGGQARGGARPTTSDIDEMHEGTVWTTGCKSWYLDDTGRNATIWPDWTFRFRRRTQRFDPSKYDLRTAVSAP